MLSTATAIQWRPAARAASLVCAVRARLRPRMDVRRAVLALLLWCITVNAPLCCIVHCQLVPWLQRQLTSASTPQFVCVFDYHAHGGDSNAPAQTPLPAVVQLAALTALLALLPPAMSRGRITLAPASGQSALLVPTTPPPRFA